MRVETNQHRRETMKTTKHTYTATAPNGQTLTRTTARTYTHCVVTTGRGNPRFETSRFNHELSSGGYAAIAYSSNHTLAVARAATASKDRYQDVQVVPCTVN
jgi:hypothetical protein